jgi:hypothetical protein
VPDYLPKHKPGDVVTYTASAAVTGGRLVTISGDLLVAQTGDGGTVEGVAGRDAATGQTVPVISGGVQLLTASVAITANQRVMAAANGAVQPWGPVAPATVAVAENIIGHATQPIAAGAVGRVRLY